jgi:hypothetical protein
VAIEVLVIRSPWLCHWVNRKHGLGALIIYLAKCDVYTPGGVINARNQSHMIENLRGKNLEDGAENSAILTFLPASLSISVQSADIALR